MRRILIGSSAIKYHFEDFTRVPKDTDYIGVNPSVGKISREEFLANPTEYMKNPVFDNYPHDVLLPNDIYTLKISHIFWNIKWEKHMYDIQFLKGKGCILQMTLFHKLYDYWVTLHGPNKRSELNMSKEDFFDNALKTYDHDYLHTLINPNPTYKKVLKDGADVDVSQLKFEKLSHDEKLDLVREEVYVMAYERLGNRDYRVAYSWMLKKFILQHAPMFEALFIVQNYRELHKPIINYKTKLDHELSRA